MSSSLAVRTSFHTHVTTITSFRTITVYCTSLLATLNAREYIARKGELILPTNVPQPAAGNANNTRRTSVAIFTSHFEPPFLQRERDVAGTGAQAEHRAGQVLSVEGAPDEDAAWLEKTTLPSIMEV